jgi:hypothetical protein
MTTEELAAAGLPTEPEIQDHEIAKPLEDHTSPAASRSGIREDGEIRSYCSKAIGTSSSVLCFRGV